MQRSDTKAQPNLQRLKNPVQRAREQVDVSQKHLAAVAEVSKPLIVHLEQGMLANVPQRVLDALLTSELDQKRLVREYREWVADTRIKNSVYLHDAIPSFITPSCSAYGNWLVFRERISSSKAGFAKLYCLHLQILDTFERKIDSRNNFTAGIRDMLIGAGVSYDNILDMELAMSRYHRSLG